MTDMTPEELAKTIGRNLKKIRKYNCVPRPRLAEAIGCNECSIYNWERGAMTPSSLYLFRLARFFSVSTDYFFKA